MATLKNINSQKQTNWKKTLKTTIQLIIMNCFQSLDLKIRFILTSMASVQK